MDEKQLQALFNAMGTQLGLDDYKSFKSNIYSDPKFRKAFFDEASQDLDLGDYNSFDNFFKKKVGGTVSQEPLPTPKVSPSVSILKEFPNQRAVSESTAIPGLKDQMAATEFAQKGKPISTVLESAKSTIDNTLQNSDKILTRIIRENRVGEFDKQRKSTPTLDAFVNPAAETAKRELLINSIVTPEEIESKKSTVISDDAAAREVLSRAAKENPNVAKSAYIIDAEARIKENEKIAPKVLNNISLIENGELSYDIKSGKLQKPEGLIKSTIRGLQERTNQIKDYDFLAGTKNNDAIISQLEADRKSFNPDEPFPVPAGAASEFFKTIGSEGIPMIKSAAAGIITGAIPGAQVAAPYVAAFVTSPEYFKRSYSSGFRQAYYNLREQGKSEQEALETARKQAESEGVYGAIEGAASSFIGARVGFKPTPIVASKSLKDVAKNVILTGKNFVTDNLPEGFADAGVAGSLQMAKNIEAINNGIDIDLFDGVADNVAGELSFTVGMGLLTKAGSTAINANTYKTVLSAISKQSKQNIDSKLGEMIVDGQITPQQADETAKRIEAFKSVSSQIPDEVEDDASRAEIVSKIEEKNKLETKLKSTNPVFHQEIKDKIKDIDQQILNTYNNATQESKQQEGLPEGGLLQPTRIEAGQPQEGQGEGGQGQGEVTPANVGNRPVGSEGQVESPLPKTDWAIITATQESVGASDNPANVEANNKLEKELIDEFGADNVKRVSGVYNGVQQGVSFLVSGVSQDRAMEIGLKYNQESVLYNNENVFSDGSGFNPYMGKIITGEEAKKQPGYSILPDGTAFSIDIAWENKLPMSKSKTRISNALRQAIPVAAKSLEDSGIKFEIVNPQTDTDAARSARGNQGLFLSEDGTIIIDESKLTDEVEAGLVVWHEASHPVMNIIRNTNMPLYDAVVRGLNEASKKNKGVSAALNWAQSQPEYTNEDTQNDEAIVETIGRINAGLIDINSLDTGFKQKLIDFINNIAKILRIDPILNDTDIAAFKKTVSQVANALKAGKSISEIVGKENVKEFKAPAPQAQAEGLFNKKETPRFKSLTDVANYIQEWANKNKLFDKSIEDVSDAEVVKKFTDHVLKEIKAWESINKDYVGFYDEDIPIRLNPELQNFAKIRYGRNLDAHEVSLYHIVSSFASPSADPVFDSSKGLEVFDMFMQEYAKDTNARPSGYTKEQATIWDTINGKRVDTGKPKFTEKGEPVLKQVAKAYAIDSLDKLNRVIDYFNGDFKKSIEWLESVHSYEDLSAVLGTPLKGDKSLKQHEYLDKSSGGFGVFAITGPKLGSYILNRVGEYSTVTKDMWYARTMARLAGENIVDKDGNVLKTPWDITKAGVRKRKLADEAFRNVAKELNTTPADVQQKIWDFEKRLYEKLGAVEKTGYASEGFMKKAKELEPSITSQQLSAGNREAKDLIKNEAAKTQGFFSDVVRGLSDKYKPIKEWVPVLSFDKKQEDFKNVFDKYMGNFDLHIATSIPTFRETQVKVGNAIVDMYKSGLVYDIGGSEGGFVKAITEASNGNIKTINLDPNPDMKAVHEATPVKGSEFVQEAFLSGFEENGITYKAHTPKSKADVVHESMVFQFITPEREAFVNEVASNYLKNDGLFITEEKFSQDKETYDNNEKQKAKYKDEYYTKEQQAMKSDDVLVGMKENQANIDTYKNILKDKFKYVEQYWDSGNFKGFVASNSENKVNEFMSKVGNTESEFTTTSLKNNAQASVGRRTDTDLGTGKEKTRRLAKRFEGLPTDTASKIEDEAIKYFERTNKQTKDAVLEFMDGKSNSDLADFVVSNPDIDDVSLVWMAAEVAKNLTKEIEQAKGDKAMVDELSTKQARIYNQFAKKATSLGQAVQAFVAFSDDPNATKFMLNKIIKQLKDKGLKEVTEEQVDKISELLENVSKAKDGLPKDEAIIELSHYLAGIAPVNGFEILQAIWYAKILSGVTTQSKNIFANLYNTSFELIAASTTQSLKNLSLMPYMYAIKGLGGGFAKGAVKGLDILLTGVKKQDEGKYFRENALETFSWGRTKLGKAGKILDFPLFIGISPKSLKMVGRALSAADAVFSSANQEAMANMLAWVQASKEGKSNPALNNFKRANEILGNTKKNIGEAKAKALSEGYRPGTTTYKRRVIELVDQSRPKKITKAGEEFGQRVTLNFEPEGFTRPFYDMVVAAQQKAPILKMWIPFTRIVANLSEQMINYTPLGFYRAISGRRNPFGSSKDVLTNDERGELAIKAAMGITALGILGAVVGDDEDDWFDVTANGTGDMRKNYELQKGGWRPYTITLKNGDKISYADWPIRGLIAGIGTVRDAQKYSETETDFSNRLTIGALGFATSMYESSLMKGLADFIDIFMPSRGKYDGIGDGLKKWAAQQAKSVLISNFTQQGLKMIDEYQGDPIKEAKGAEIIYRDIPIINDGLNPIIDVFGDPVKPTTSEKLLPYFSVSDDKKDKLIKFLNEKKIFVGIPAKKNIIDLTTEEEIPMTDKQYYDYKKLYGQKLKSYLYEYVDEYKGEDLETIKTYVSALKRAASAEAESELFYE